MITGLSKFFVLLFILLPFGLTTGCATPPGSRVSWESDTSPGNEDEKMLWQKSEAEQRLLESTGLIYQDEELEAYLNKVVAKLQPQVARADLPIRVKVIKNAYLNAFAYPNGMIYIHTGLLARMDNEAQL
jgi:predicted Zn-dependent protease